MTASGSARDADAPAIEVVDLRKVYDGRSVVDGVSFSVEPGEVFALLGPNGAGKTTTIEILEGYRRPDGGSVRVLGHDPVRDHVALRARVGVMLQEGGVYPGIRALEALELFASYYADAEPPARLLEAIGLTDEAKTAVRHLSGGQRQRLALALALVGRPRALFLDEPTAGMDPHARRATWELVRERRDQGVVVMLTTHAMDEAESLADRVAILDRGSVVASGSPAELGADLAAEETRFRASSGLDLAALAAALGLTPGALREEQPGDYVVMAPATGELVADLTAWLRDQGVVLGDLRAARRSLEDVFVRLTTEATSADEQA